MHLTHPETVPSSPVDGKIVFYKTSRWCRKRWGLLAALEHQPLCDSCEMLPASHLGGFCPNFPLFPLAPRKVPAHTSSSAEDPPPESLPCLSGPGPSSAHDSASHSRLALLESAFLFPSQKLSESGNQPDPTLHLPYQDQAGPGVKGCLLSERLRKYEDGHVNPGP